MTTLYDHLKEIGRVDFVKILESKPFKEDPQLYLDFIDRLLLKTPNDNGWVYTFEMGEDGFLEGGIRIGERENEADVAIDFTPWEECLGCRIAESDVEKYSIGELVYTVLYDMSFDGFTEESQIQSFNELLERVNEVKNLDK